MADSEITTHGSTVEEWTRALGKSVGSPGGGAGAGVMLAIAASLTSMVAGYTDAGAEQRDQLEDLHARAQELRRTALQLADDDASASRAFGAAFRLEKGDERDQAIREASLGAARSSATLGDHAVAAIADLSWLAENGNRALIADVVVAFGALRAAVTGARTNVSFDLATLRSSGLTLEQVREQQPRLWAAVEKLDAAIVRIDQATAAVDHRAAPTDTA
ncbi:hypothetical protein GCM10027404_26390 [Arthrobacter tumbae]|uniref:cyclodeaminase/cyclohydrolase family protein n=1 Tax=Arthrobacter tumbae TaxID=163874 RepID=UPI00195CC1AE|nr:cyclodeaminase/cyclohydrolase family protein [Arthrobacter tumbae]MBM7781662.1 formiminotetrahydrofolate cyclodeaminase [Arthrobacter tumbae]